MRLLASALLAAAIVAAVPALAQDAGGSSARADQDNRYLEIPGQMTPDARATIPSMPYASSTVTAITQTGQLPQPTVMVPAPPSPLTSR